MKKLNQIVQNRVLQHFLFWLLSFYFLAKIFGQEYGAIWTELNLIYVLLFHGSIWLVVYPNLLVWIPRFLREKKYFLFSLFLGLNLLFATWFNLLIFNDLSDFLFPNYYFISYFDYVDIFKILSIYLGVSTLFKLSKSWFQLAENQQLIASLKEAKKSAELEALKAQINPHFLFNSLNNLYALALDKEPKTPEVILKLSESMRYMLYESNDDFVPLKKEIKYLKNYLELQQLRVEDEAEILLKIEGEIEGKMIAPLLLIPFVENAFKHGIKGASKAVFLNVYLKVKKEEIYFEIKNNKGQVDEVETGEFSGIGLNNVRQRLELLYPERHELTIVDGSDFFLVTLSTWTK